MSGYRNGSESEGLGFNLCVAPPRIVASLISRDRSRIGDRRSEVGDDFVVKTKSDKDNKKGIQVMEPEEDLRE